MFNVEAGMFFQAQNSLNDGSKKLQSLKNYSSSCTSSYPKGYEYKSEVEEVHSLIAEAQNSIYSVVQNVDELKEKLCNLDNAFALEYYQNATLKYESLGPLTEEQQTYLEYNQQQYYEQLYSYLDANKDNLTKEQKEIYNALKEENKLKAKYDKLEKLYKEKEDNNGLIHPIIEKDINDKIKKLEKELNIYQNKWYEDIKDAITKTGATWKEGITSVAAGEGGAKLLEAFEQTGATCAVISRSAQSGLAKLGEWILIDGVSTIGGSIAAGATWLFHDTWSDNDVAGKVMDSTLDFVRRDLVGESNKDFYEKSLLGKYINDKSNLKYDSKGAKAIQNTTEFVGKVALATGATIATGGAAAPIALGALYGAGKASESYTQTVDRDNGEKYNYLKAIGKSVAGGVAGASEFYGYGQMGSAIYSGLKSLEGVTSTVSSTASSTASTSFKKNFAKNFFEIDTLLDTGAVIMDHGVDYIAGDTTLKDFLKGTSAELVLALGLTALGAGLSAKAQTKAAILELNSDLEIPSLSKSLESLDVNSNNNIIEHNVMKIDELTIKKLSSKSEGQSVAKTLKNMSSKELNDVFSSHNINSWLKQISDNEFITMLKNMDKNHVDAWLQTPVIVDRFLSLDSNKFLNVELGLWGTVAEAIKSGNVESYLRILNRFDDLLTPEMLAYNPKYYKNLDSWINTYTSNEIVKTKINMLKLKEDSSKQIILNSLNNNSPIKFSYGKFSQVSSLKLDDLESRSYYVLKYEVDNIPVTKEIRSLGDNATVIFSDDEIIKISSGKLKILSFEKDAVKSNFFLGETDGLKKGLNKVKYKLDDKEKIFLVDFNGYSHDFNSSITDEFKDVKLLSVENLPSYNIENAVKDKIYEISYKIGDQEKVSYLVSKYNSWNKTSIVNVNSFLAENNLYGATDIKTKLVDIDSIDISRSNIYRYKSSIDLFTKDKFGGNQSDVPKLLRSLAISLEKGDISNLSNIEFAKSRNLLEIARKYYPNATMLDVLNLADAYANSGCCYMALANSIATYMGAIDNGKEIFKQKFGYDLCYNGVNGLEYNVEAIAFDIFNDLSEFKDIKEAIKNAHGLSGNALIDKEIKNVFKKHGLSFEAKNIHSSADTLDSFKNDLLVETLNSSDKGSFSIIMSSGFDLESLDNIEISKNADFALKNSRKTGEIISDIGGHAMLVTDFDSDKNPIVSSWSGKYKYMPESVLKRKNSGSSGFVTNIKIGLLD